MRGATCERTAVVDRLGENIESASLKRNSQRLLKLALVEAPIEHSVDDGLQSGVHSGDGRHRLLLLTDSQCNIFVDTFGCKRIQLISI